jgi:hypothetical protein
MRTSVPNIKTIKSRGIRCGHVARIGKKWGAYKDSVGKSERKKTPDGKTLRYLKVTGRTIMGSIHLDQYRVSRPVLVNTVQSL